MCCSSFVRVGSPVFVCISAYSIWLLAAMLDLSFVEFEFGGSFDSDINSNFTMRNVLEL
jgi:hypothetical protein